MSWLTFTEVGGLRTYYESKGDGFPLIFVHGAGANHKVWKEQLKTFSAGYRAIAIDLPGHRKSDPLPSEISIERYASFVDGFLNALGLEEAVVSGHSMGGAVCIQLCLDFPNRVRCLGLVNTGAKLGVNPAMLSALRENFRAAVGEGFMSMLGKTERLSPLLEEVRDEMVKTDPAVGVADFGACDKFDCRRRLPEIKKPSLIVGGTEDVLTPPWYQSYLHEHIKNSTLVLMEGVGHLSMVEKPDEFNRALLGFLERNLGKSPARIGSHPSGSF